MKLEKLLSKKISVFTVLIYRKCLKSRCLKSELVWNQITKMSEIQTKSYFPDTHLLIMCLKIKLFGNQTNSNWVSEIHTSLDLRHLLYICLHYTAKRFYFIFYLFCFCLFLPLHQQFILSFTASLNTECFNIIGLY